MLRRLRRFAAGIWRGDSLGRRGERVAAGYLEERGLRILGRNVRQGRLEIDLVAVDGPTLVFVEVKSHTHNPAAEVTGLEKLNAAKRRALRRACALYRKRARPAPESYRLDAVTVEFMNEGGRLRVREVRWYPGVMSLD